MFERTLLVHVDVAIYPRQAAEACDEVWCSVAEGEVLQLSRVRLAGSVAGKSGVTVSPFTCRVNKQVATATV